MEEEMNHRDEKKNSLLKKRKDAKTICRTTNLTYVAFVEYKAWWYKMVNGS